MKLNVHQTGSNSLCITNDGHAYMHVCACVCIDTCTLCVKLELIVCMLHINIIFIME